MELYLGEDTYETWEYILETLCKEECRRRYILWERMRLKDIFWKAYNDKLRQRIIKLQQEGASNKV